MKSVQKLRQVHLPLINSVLGTAEYPWEITHEEYNPDWLRIVNCQNITAGTAQDVILTVLRRAYGLADGWKISGLNEINALKIRHVSGTWDAKKRSNSPPALASMIFELQSGRIDHKTDDGGWILDNGRAQF